MILNFTLLIIFVLIALFYRLSAIVVENPGIYLTISTFLFAIFISYFINRQNTRYNKIREQVALNDGHFSTIFRLFSNFSAKAWQQAGKIIKNHFANIIKNRDWVYNIKYKSTTLTDLNNLIADETRGKKLDSLRTQSLRQIQSSLANLQITRKTIWTLHSERLTFGQWLIIGALTIILLFTISFIGGGSPAIYFTKVICGFVVVLIIMLLYKLDRLLLFKDDYGKRSSLDVINIIEGKK